MPTQLAPVLALAVLCAAAALGAATGQAPALPAGITRTVLVDNDTVLIARIGMAPGAKEDIHTHPFSAVAIQIVAGDVDMRLGGTHTTSPRERGFVEFNPGRCPTPPPTRGTGR